MQVAGTAFLPYFNEVFDAMFRCAQLAHTYTHTHMHTHTHAHTHTHTCTHAIHTSTHTHMHTCHTHKHAHTHAHMPYTQARTQIAKAHKERTVLIWLFAGA